MSDQASFGIRITTNDQTSRGAKAAEKRVGAIPKHLSAVNRRQAEVDERTARRSSRGFLRAFGAVEQATARALGGRSITAGVTERLGSIRAAGAAAGAGLGEAAASGGMLSNILGGLGVVAGATVGILATAAFGAFKFADGWAKGAASIGRLAELLGIGTKGLQEFTAAGERVGVDKATSTGAISGLTKTLNDARYGRNNEAVALMARMGLKMKTKADGTADVEAMLPDIANKLKGQNSSGRRSAAAGLGISEAALAMFTQGAGRLKWDMEDAGQNAPIISDDDVVLGKRITRRHTRISQRAQKEVIDRAGRWAAKGLDAAETAAAQALKAVTNEFAPGARKIDRAADKMERAAGQMERASAGGRGTIGLTRDVVAAAQATEKKYGIPASITLGQFGLESSWGRHMPRGSNNPFGIKARPGEPYVTARTREEDRSGRSYYVDARFRKFDTLGQAFDEHAKLLAFGRPYRNARSKLPNVGAFADALTGTYATDQRYGQKLKAIIGQKGLSQYDGGRPPQEIPVKVEIDLRGAPPGTQAKVTAGRGKRPAVSHAMPRSYTPARGG